MNLEGLEMIAVLVVLVLFVKVLEQFGLFEPVALEGNRGGGCWPLWGHGGTSEGSLCCFGDGGGKEEPPGPNPAGPAPMSPGDSPRPPQVSESGEGSCVLQRGREGWGHTPETLSVSPCGVGTAGSTGICPAVRTGGGPRCPALAPIAPSPSR